MEFKAKFKRTADAGLNLRGASVNFRSASLSLYDANMKFKISDLLCDDSGANFKSASLNLHGDKELEFKSSAACFCGLKRRFKRSAALNFKISNPPFASQNGSHREILKISSQASFGRKISFFALPVKAKRSSLALLHSAKFYRLRLESKWGTYASKRRKFRYATLRSYAV